MSCIPIDTKEKYCILSSIVCTILHGNDAEIFPAHYTWKVTEKGFQMASMMNKLAMINSCEIIIEKLKYFFAKNHCEIQVRTILACTLYSIKYSRFAQHISLLDIHLSTSKNKDPSTGHKKAGRTACLVSLAAWLPCKPVCLNSLPAFFCAHY